MALTVVYFGRLETAKGVRVLLDARKQLATTGKSFTFCFFGSGNLQSKLPKAISPADFSNTQPGIYYFGQQDFTMVIKPFLRKHADYVIMPSVSLETFGLSALESLQAGVPIIAPNKGGLAQFVLPEHTLDELTATEVTHLLTNLQKPTPAQKEKITQIADHYSDNHWLHNIKKLFPKNTSKILLVSDFLSLLGGTETHVQQASTLLAHAGYKVTQFGQEMGKPSLYSVLQAGWNYQSAGYLAKKIQQFQPDVIWCHSVLRSLGPAALRVINRSSAYKVITHHDFGLFCERPSQLRSIEELEHYPSLWGKFKKRFLIKPITKELQHFDLHIVPSPFMKPILEQKFTSVSVVGHFVGK